MTDNNDGRWKTEINLHFCMHEMLIRYCRFLKFKICHNLKKYSYLCLVISFCVPPKELHTPGNKVDSSINCVARYVNSTAFIKVFAKINNLLQASNKMKQR